MTGLQLEHVGKLSQGAGYNARNPMPISMLSAGSRPVDPLAKKPKLTYSQFHCKPFRLTVFHRLEYEHKETDQWRGHLKKWSW